MKRKAGLQQLQSVSKRLAINGEYSTTHNKVTSFETSVIGNREQNVESDFIQKVYDCIDIGNGDFHVNSDSNIDNTSLNESNESSFQRNLFSEEEYQFLRDYYQDNDCCSRKDEDILSNHSFTSIEKVVNNTKLDELMKKLLRFAVKAKLTETCLSQALELFKESFSSFGMISSSDLEHFTLKGFYQYFYINQKTRLIRYCMKCKEYEKNQSTSACSCGKKWKELPTYCYLRPLKFQMDERLFWNPSFRNQFQQDIKEINDKDIISDRVHGSVYQKYHRKEYNDGKTDCITFFGDSVSPFGTNTHSFYQVSFNFTEMKPHYRKKQSNNFLWFMVPRKPDHEEIKLFLKILMDDLNHFNSLSNRKIRLERIVCDLPARSEILFFKQSGEYFCHLCLIKGESVEINTTKQTRYPLSVDPLTDHFTPPAYRTNGYWKKQKSDNLDQGMKSKSPILNQDWKPTPSLICCYDSMHVLYEGILQDMMAMIPVSYWEKFDLLFLKQKYPSFLHKHPRKTTNGQTMNSLKAIEVYMITHYYLELFTCIENYQAIEREVNLIRRFVNIIDSLTDSFISSELDSIELELLQVLKDYQDIVSVKKATPNFHICTELVTCCRLYGPLAMNSAFIGEGLNFTLSKTYVCSNSARYSIMYFDMCQLCDLLDLNEHLNSGQCVVGHYVVSKKRDVLMDTKTKKVYQVASFSDDYNSIQLAAIDDPERIIEISRKKAFKMLPCVVLDFPNRPKKYIPVHYNTYQYI